MAYETDVRLVYPHSESVCRHDYPRLSTFPALLYPLTGLLAHAGMVGLCDISVCDKESGYLLGAAAHPHIDYPCPGHALAYREQLPELVLAFAHYIGKVFTLEAPLNQIGPPEFELLHYVRSHLRRGSGRKGDYRDLPASYLPYFRDFKIIRPEVIPPLGYAMRLIYNDICNLHILQSRYENLRSEPFGREIKELEIPVHGIVQRRVYFLGGHSRIYGKRLDSARIEVGHLVFHQGYQRGYDDAYTLLHQRRHLETHRFAASCRQYGQYIVSVYG